jgi:hypothetical protein
MNWPMQLGFWIFFCVGLQLIMFGVGLLKKKPGIEKTG